MKPHRTSARRLVKPPKLFRFASWCALLLSGGMLLAGFSGGTPYAWIVALGACLLFFGSLVLYVFHLAQSEIHETMILITDDAMRLESPSGFRPKSTKPTQ